jgi:hypothetical protein
MNWNKWKVWTDHYLSNESKMRSDWFSNLVHNSLKNRNQTSLRKWKEEGAQKLLEHVEQPVGVGQPHTTVQPSQATNIKKHINENELSGIYSKLMYITIAKLNALLKKLTRPFFVLIITNEQRLSALNDTGADVCCMSSKTFRRVFPVRQQPEKLNSTSSISTPSENKLGVEIM